MSGFTRTTRTCPPSQIHPGLSQAVREYFQAHQLGDPDTETLHCCETMSRRATPSKLVSILAGNPDTDIHLALLLTTDWLIWARHGDRTGTVVTGARLQVIKVKAFVRRRSNDMELEISGFMADTKQYVRGSLELGPDPAAQKFCEVVVAAVLKATPPTKNRFLGMLGG